MKFYIVALAFFSFAFTHEADAFIYSAGGEKIALVEEGDGDEGALDDTCVIYKQFWILWVPLWNWDARYVYADAKSESSSAESHLTMSDQSYAQSEHGGAAAKIPFWDKVGGKLVAVGLLVFFVYRLFAKRGTAY